MRRCRAPKWSSGRSKDGVQLGMMNSLLKKPEDIAYLDGGVSGACNHMALEGQHEDNAPVLGLRVV